MCCIVEVYIYSNEHTRFISAFAAAAGAGAGAVCVRYNPYVVLTIAIFETQAQQHVHEYIV